MATGFDLEQFQQTQNCPSRGTISACNNHNCFCYSSSQFQPLTQNFQNFIGMITGVMWSIFVVDTVKFVVSQISVINYGHSCPLSLVRFGLVWCTLERHYNVMYRFITVFFRHSKCAFHYNACFVITHILLGSQNECYYEVAVYVPYIM